MDGAPAFAVSFFLLLILSGIDSEFGSLKAFVFYVLDFKWIKMKQGFFYGK